ncbi:MAG: 3-dehydroquinate synthase [Bacillota bacterium]|nr:3-dehydroquinate synthase [Bacillota bacterium]
MGDANLVLIGFMGSGKSTVGRLVAEAAGLAFLDTDEEIERRTGRPVRAIFADQGEEEFRRVEAEVVAEAAARRGQVIATGGGVVLREGNLEALRRTGLVVALTARTDALWERVGASDRPLLAVDQPLQRFEELLRLRAPLYARADVVVDTTDLDPREVAATVTGHWRLATAAGRVEVRLDERGYVVYVGAGLLESVGAAAQMAAGGDRVALVTDPVVDGLYGETVRQALRAARRQVVTLVVPEGEAAKQLGVVEELYHRALAAGLERDDLVVALGGGAVGDAAGFFAATYLRGLAFLQVPTTLLAQIDSSVGGKVGVNLPLGKNLVGAFHQPRAVIADPSVLRTLSLREFRSGLAEVIKHGVLADPELFARLEQWPPLEAQASAWPSDDELAEAVRAAVAVKAAVVAVDEREAGPRMTLNLGHTAGHAVEAVTGFGPVRHGEAVAYGMAVAARLAQRLGLCPEKEAGRIVSLLARFGLPTRREELAAPAGVEDILRALSRDKKVRRSRVRWVLPRGIGEVTVTDEVPEPLVQECL